MITKDDSDNQKSSKLDGEQDNICLMVDTNKKVEVKTLLKNIFYDVHLTSVPKNRLNK